MSLDQPLCSSVLKIAPCMSFPRKRESIGLTMGPRIRGDDADFHFHRWAEGPWKLPSAARQWPGHPPNTRRDEGPQRRAKCAHLCATTLEKSTSDPGMYMKTKDNDN